MSTIRWLGSPSVAMVEVFSQPEKNRPKRGTTVAVPLSSHASFASMTHGCYNDDSFKGTPPAIF